MTITPWPRPISLTNLDIIRTNTICPGFHQEQAAHGYHYKHSRLRRRRPLIYAELCGQLPLPVDATPEARALRDEYAMASVDALHPANAIEARLAVRAVTTDAHAADAMREAALAAGDPAEKRRCRAQAVSMARQSDAVLRTLHRIQATREKQEAEIHPSRMERDGFWWRGVKVPEAAPEPELAHNASAEAPEPPPPTQAEIEAEAERYARLSAPNERRASAPPAACLSI